MIITISGAGCTGKTTLLKYIENTLNTKNTVKYHGEFIRYIFDKKYKDKYNSFEDLLLGDPIDIINIHKETARLFNEILWSSNLNDIIIFDRSPLDISIYLYMNLIDHLKDTDTEVYEKYREASKYIHRCASDFMNHNPILFYTRPFQDIVEEDGFRPTSLIQRRALEISLFDKEFLSLPDVHVLPSNLDDRFCKVIEVLRGIHIKELMSII